MNITKIVDENMQEIAKNTIPLRPDVYQNTQYNNIRRNKILMFAAILNQYSAFKEKPRDEQYDLVCQLENSCYNAAMDKREDIIKTWANSCFEHIYHQICSNIASNLDSNSSVGSTYLGNHILNGDLNIKNIGKMTSRELCPEKYVEYDEHLHQRMHALSAMKTTELYTCFKCKRKQCVLENVINRSIDEGTSLVVHCMFCGNSWSG